MGFFKKFCLGDFYKLLVFIVGIWYSIWLGIVVLLIGMEGRVFFFLERGCDLFSDYRVCIVGGRIGAKFLFGVGYFFFFDRYVDINKNIRR